jgi:hypothetical protein
MNTIKSFNEGIISASDGDFSKIKDMVKDTKIAKGIETIDAVANKKSLEPGKFIDSGLDNVSKKMGLNRDSSTIGKDKAKKYHSFKKGATQGLTKKQSVKFNKKIKGIDGKFEKGIDGKFKKAEFKFMGKKKSMKYTDITFFFVIVYVIICLYIDETKDDNWWSIFVLHPQTCSYIFMGFVVSLVSDKELGFPIKIMRRMMEDLMGTDNEYGFSYFLEKIWTPLFTGLRKGSKVSAVVFSWSLAKLILYIPLLTLTFFQYLIPVIFTIVLIPVTLIIGLITGIFTMGAGAEVSGTIGEVTEEGEAEIDMFVASVIKKIWRTINKIIPFKKIIGVYIVGYIFYTVLFKMLITVYLTFAVIIIVHIIFNTLLIKGLLNTFLKLIEKYTLLKIIGYILIIGLYYYIQYKINYEFIMNKRDPLSVFIQDFLYIDIPWKTPIDIKKHVFDLLCPDKDTSTTDDIIPYNMKQCLYFFITLMTIKLLTFVAKGVGKFDT